jgi:hypothetical protein
MQKEQKNRRKAVRDGRIVILVSSLVIVAILLYFLISGVSKNPLEGEWYCEDTGYVIEVDNSRELDVELLVKEEMIETKVLYEMDKDTKVISIKPHKKAYEETAKDMQYLVTASMIDESLLEFIGSYEYSVEKNTLTLMNREYGEKLIFTRVD